MKLIAILFVIVIHLHGCAGSPQDLSNKASQAKTALLGVPIGTVISCAGVPTETAKISGVEYMSYRREGCIATLTVKDGAVSKVNYSGKRGALTQPWQACGAIFYGCFAQ